MEARPTIKTQGGMPYGENCITERTDTQVFFEKHLDFLTSVPQRRMQEIILASCAKGNSGKMTDYAEVFPVHRTTYGHFLSKGKWDDEKVAQTQKHECFQLITELAASEQSPIFISIDDTVAPKTKPSSKAKRPTEGAGWHYSHLEGKVVYGYQVHAAIVSTGKTALCYSLKRYSKEGGTKVEMTLDVINSLPDQAGAYILMDSWYTNPDILDECREKGCHLIGAMKTNRILYPNGQRTSAMDYARTISQSQFHLVTVKSREYWVHRYEGSLNKISKAVVLLSYPKEAFGNLKALRVFLCSDLSPDDETIPKYYSHRWKIEVLFRSQKRYMGFKSFMVRAARAFDRLLIILCVAQFFFTCGLGAFLPFEASIRSCRASLADL